MRTNTSNKTLLTVIAIFIVFIIIYNLQINLNADTGSIKNKCGNALPVNKDESIKVKLSVSDQIDVNSKEIKTYHELRVDMYTISTGDELDINIDGIAYGSTSHGSAIKVKAQN